MNCINSIETVIKIRKMCERADEIRISIPQHIISELNKIYQDIYSKGLKSIIDLHWDYLLMNTVDLFKNIFIEYESGILISNILFGENKKISEFNDTVVKEAVKIITEKYLIDNEEMHEDVKGTDLEEESKFNALLLRFLTSGYFLFSDLKDEQSSAGQAIISEIRNVCGLESTLETDVGETALNLFFNGNKEESLSLRKSEGKFTLSVHEIITAVDYYLTETEPDEEFELFIFSCFDNETVNFYNLIKKQFFKADGKTDYYHLFDLIIYITDDKECSMMAMDSKCEPGISTVQRIISSEKYKYQNNMTQSTIEALIEFVGDIINIISSGNLADKNSVESLVLPEYKCLMFLELSRNYSDSRTSQYYLKEAEIQYDLIEEKEMWFYIISEIIEQYLKFGVPDDFIKLCEKFSNDTPGSNDMYNAYIIRTLLKLSDMEETVNKWKASFGEINKIASSENNYWLKDDFYGRILNYFLRTKDFERANKFIQEHSQKDHFIENCYKSCYASGCSDLAEYYFRDSYENYRERERFSCRRTVMNILMEIELIQS